MRIHIVSSPSASPSLLIEQYRQRGNIVTHSDSVPSDADLYVFSTGHNAIKRLTHGLVVADLRYEPDLEAPDWLPYTDLCLVHSPSDQAALIEVHACEPERVYVVRDNDEFLDLVDKALQDVLPPAKVPTNIGPPFPPGEPKTEIAMADPLKRSEMLGKTSTQQIAALSVRLKVAERQTDVMPRDYRVQSRVPLVGPLISWARRNLTSHLREPYVDPTLERQVALNRDLVKALEEILSLVANLEARLAQTEDQHSDD